MSQWFPNRKRKKNLLQRCLPTMNNRQATNRLKSIPFSISLILSLKMHLALHTHLISLSCTQERANVHLQTVCLLEVFPVSLAFCSSVYTTVTNCYGLLSEWLAPVKQKSITLSFILIHLLSCRTSSKLLSCLLCIFSSFHTK